MSNRSVLRDIIRLSAQLRPSSPYMPFTNTVYRAAAEMLANEPKQESRDDSLTNHERMLRNKIARQSARPTKEVL